MTITTFEENDETEQLQSEPSSPVLGLSKGQELELTSPIDLFHEMKFEMRSTKGAAPNSSVLHDRLKAGLSSASSTTPSSVSPLLGTADRDRAIYATKNMPVTQAVSRQQQPHLSNSPFEKDVSKVSRPLGLTTIRPLSTDHTGDHDASIRSRLRRQRRMLSQGSTDQPEDPMERLNRLRARISGALSEVKGVLNKYSTELEPNDSVAHENQQLIPQTSQVEQTKQDDSCPIQFRFVKKVRRRSVFDNGDEKDKSDDIKEINNEKSTSLKPEESHNKSIAEISSKLENKTKEDIPIIEIDAVPDQLPIKVHENNSVVKKDSKSSTENLKAKNALTIQNKTGGRRVSIGTIQEVDTREAPKIKTQRRPSDSTAVLKNLPKTELNSRQLNEQVLGKTLKNVKNENSQTFEKSERDKKLTIKNTKNVIKSKESTNDELSPKKSDGGKCLLIKRNNSLRRSSIGAVERSKIEPPVKDNFLPNIKTQRRPSDSGAILKKPITAREEESLMAPKSQTKQISTTKRVEKNLKTPTNTSIVDNNIETLRTTGHKNSCKDDAVDKQSALMPIHSTVKVIVNETSIPPSSMPPSSAIGRATTETVITPPDIPLISDGHKIANSVVVPSRLSQVNDSESSSQQLNSAQLNHIPLSVPLKKFTPVSTDIAVNKTVEVSKKGQEVVEPIQTNINHAATVLKNDGVINQQKIIPVPIKIPTTFSPQSSLSSSVQQTSVQQVAGSAELAAIASGSGDDICVPDTSEKTVKKSLSEVNVSASSQIVTIPKNSFTDDVATKTVGNITAKQKSATSKAREQESKKSIEEIMPELQVHSAPVKAVTIHSDSETSIALGESKEMFPKKKIVLKKIIRKNSTEKPTRDKNEDREIVETIPEILTISEEKPTTETSPSPKSHILHEDDDADADADAEDKESSPIAPNRARKVKKKVIIKRLQRRLSGSEQTFFVGTSDEKSTNDVETLEKAIAYVTDDDDDDYYDDTEEEPSQQNTPLKSCMRLREYQVGDIVLYAERYKKTQVRWKKGRIIERITSISYKVDIGEKEVSAHIKDLKKYTGLKVRFGDKEYLEIDYEQIAEEEQKARTYSIWNLV